MELRQAADSGGWELVETLAEGETFGQLSLLSRSPTCGTRSPGAAPDDVVAVGELTALQRRWLEDAFQLVHTYQDSVRIAFQTDLIA